MSIEAGERGIVSYFRAIAKGITEVRARWPAVFALLGLASATYADCPVILIDPVTPQNRAVADAAIRAFPRLRELSGYPVGWKELVREAPVVVAVGAPAWAQARAHGSGSLVAAMVPGLDIAELPKKATGVRLETDPAEVLNQLRPLISGNRVELFIGPALSDFRVRAKAAAGSLGLTLNEHLASGPAQAQELLRKLEPGAGALWLSPDSQLFNAETFNLAVETSRKLRVPLIGFSHAMTRTGAVASFSLDEVKTGSETGELARGLTERAVNHEPQVIPTIRFSPGELTLNARAAQDLGIRFPDRLRLLATYLFR